MMNRLEQVLNNQGENYIFPFFWQHGEDEHTLRTYMRVIDECNIKAVCVESRPHPDFCGPKWWMDMDIILEEAKKRAMKVWILDDSHFPTGYANGAMEKKPERLCRQGICCRIYECRNGQELVIEEEQLMHPEPFVPNDREQELFENVRVFSDDELLGIYGIRTNKVGNVIWESVIDLRSYITENTFRWEVPTGNWRVYILHTSRNVGYHRNYINMMNHESCRVLLDSVYEPHWEHYKEEFGKTIAGFFSDEPELGNGHIYETGNLLGMEGDLPWSDELSDRMRSCWGMDFPQKLLLLWENHSEEKERAAVRYTYMDAVTKLVEKDFSRQIGDWCREHGVKYIGHIIEDNDQHARMGSSLGHYFRGMTGQDMAGIDDIGGQVIPQGEDLVGNIGPFGSFKDGEFYHYMLGKLASSAAAIEPWKHGDSMCEIFGAYGWKEGVRLEKYLADHFLVRGINHYVPHAFSAKEFPDPDCPPHFYAHGNNPQHRHFGKLMAYMNRICHMLSGGVHVAPVAILYHGEGEWTGNCMLSHRPAHLLADAQIEYDYIPQDVFAALEAYRVQIKNKVLRINTQEYRVVVVPFMQFVTKALAKAVERMVDARIPVVFLDGFPEGICDASAEEAELLLQAFEKTEVAERNQLVSGLQEKHIPEIRIEPADDRIRYLHYVQEDGTHLYLFVNEGENTYRGNVIFLGESFLKTECYYYDAWDNCLYEAEYHEAKLSLEIEPRKSRMAVFGKMDKENVGKYLKKELRAEGEEIEIGKYWKRSICRSIDYPKFKEQKEIALPDRLMEEKPEFSGFVKYESTFLAKKEGQYSLHITEAYEGVEVFLNGKNLGIQIVPEFRYDLTPYVRLGENQIVIEVATTLEREMAKYPNMFGQLEKSSAMSGITGEVKLFWLDSLHSPMLK